MRSPTMRRAAAVTVALVGLGIAGSALAQMSADSAIEARKRSS
jgi:hypothetical protein